MFFYFFFFSSRRRHTRSLRDWSSDVCSSDLVERVELRRRTGRGRQLAPLRLLEHRGAEQRELRIAEGVDGISGRSEEHTSELQSRRDLVCRLLLEKKNTTTSVVARIAV